VGLPNWCILCEAFHERELQAASRSVEASRLDWVDFDVSHVCCSRSRLQFESAFQVYNFSCGHRCPWRIEKSWGQSLFESSLRLRDCKLADCETETVTRKNCWRMEATDSDRALVRPCTGAVSRTILAFGDCFPLRSNWSSWLRTRDRVPRTTMSRESKKSCRKRCRSCLQQKLDPSPEIGPSLRLDLRLTGRPKRPPEISFMTFKFKCWNTWNISYVWMYMYFFTVLVLYFNFYKKRVELPTTYTRIETNIFLSNRSKTKNP